VTAALQRPVDEVADRFADDPATLDPVLATLHAL